MPERENPVRNVLLNGSRLVVSTAASIVASAIVVRKLGPEGTGLYAYVLWISGVMVAVSHLGLPTSLTKYVSGFLVRDDRDDASRIVRFFLLVQLAGAMLVAAIGGIIVHSFTGLRGQLFWFALLLVVPQAMQQTLAGALIGAQRYKDLTLASVWSGVSQTGLIVVVALFRSSVSNFVLVLLLSNLVQAGITYRFVRKHLLQPSGDLNKRASGFPGALRFAGTIYYLVLLDMVVWQRSELFFLKRYSGLKEIAFYSIAYLMASKIGEVVVIMTSTLLPLQVEGIALGGMQRSGDIQKRAMRSIHLALAPLIGAAMVVARPLVLSLYGTEYQAVVLLFLLMLISPVAQVFTEVGVSTAYAGERERSLVFPLGLMMLLNIGLASLLVPRFGALGAVEANCIAQAAEAGIVVYIAAMLLPLSIPWEKIGKTYAVAALAFFPLWFFTRSSASLLMTLGVAICGIALYLGILRVLSEIGPEDWLVLRDAFLGRLNASAA